MKILILLGVLFACGMSFQTMASADDIIDQYCMESSSGGGTMVSCSFESMAQCLASKGGPSDRCFVNPRPSRRR
jgi:Protein of unknown function (DUF3551)